MHRSSSSTGVLSALVLTAAALSGCAPRSRLCTATSDCASGAACVAGRCQPDRPSIKPSIEAARRLVFRPVDVGYVRRGGLADGELPAEAPLGRDGAVLFLRFEAAVPASAKLVEAYLVLRRAVTVDDDPAAVHLHATRIVEPWTGRSTSMARQPRHVEVAAPVTTVEPGGPGLVRLDVRKLVGLWARHDPADHGIAVVGTGGANGTTFALAPGAEPYLELYVR